MLRKIIVSVGVAVGVVALFFWWLLSVVWTDEPDPRPTPSHSTGYTPAPTVSTSDAGHYPIVAPPAHPVGQ